MSLSLVLASTSSFRKEILNRLHIPFDIFAPNVDETRLINETPIDLVKRLAKLKAQSAQTSYPKALIIGSDQVAVIGDNLLGKPGTHQQAIEQLNFASGKQVDFITGICLLNTETGKYQLDLVNFKVKFRNLSLNQIENYLNKEKPYNCSGSFKSEGLGVALLEKMEGNDSTAIVGLPLIRLIQMLENENLFVL
ncbi:MAG: septum formation inhibitor Maf [Thiomargarita sp.]|nr:septum formation inhibitor Maf [Thiomargarita sp.]